MISLKDILSFLVSEKLQFYLLPLKLIFIGASLYFLFYWVYFKKHTRPVIDNSLSVSWVEVVRAVLKGFIGFWQDKKERLQRRRKGARANLMFLEGMEVVEKWVEKIGEERIPDSLKEDLLFLREIKNKILSDSSFYLEGEEKDRAFELLSFLLDTLPQHLPSQRK